MANDCDLNMRESMVNSCLVVVRMKQLDDDVLELQFHNQNMFRKRLMDGIIITIEDFWKETVSRFLQQGLIKIVSSHKIHAI